MTDEKIHDKFLTIKGLTCLSNIKSTYTAAMNFKRDCAVIVDIVLGHREMYDVLVRDRQPLLLLFALELTDLWGQFNNKEIWFAMS